MFDVTNEAVAPADDPLCVYLLLWEAGRENTSERGPRRNLSHYLLLLPEIRPAKPGSESLSLSQRRFFGEKRGREACLYEKMHRSKSWLAGSLQTLLRA